MATAVPGSANGGGWITDPTGSHGNFGFNVKSGNGKNSQIQGKSVYIWRGTYNDAPADFSIKSTAWNKFAIANTPNSDPLAPSAYTIFEAKAVYQIKDPVTGETIFSEGNWKIVVKAYDVQEPGKGFDHYTITIMDKNGVKVREPSGLLQGGNIQVHLK